MPVRAVAAAYAGVTEGTDKGLKVGDGSVRHDERFIRREGKAMARQKVFKDFARVCDHIRYHLSRRGRRSIRTPLTDAISRKAR